MAPHVCIFGVLPLRREAQPRSALISHLSPLISHLNKKKGGDWIASPFLSGIGLISG